MFSFALGQIAAWSNSIWQPDLSLFKVNLKMNLGKIQPAIRNPFSVYAEDFLIAFLILKKASTKKNNSKREKTLKLFLLSEILVPVFLNINHQKAL